ncbi:major facilitator superfamily domain-containing protein [Aspergillus pseudoustus]|uniref:Major facilitator superfamily domain-containing protein n=1 Tax=Aspergillus pseudoustus TaxID=1810923 RepID=A0ABR4IQV7_9EURO
MASAKVNLYCLMVASACFEYLCGRDRASERWNPAHERETYFVTLLHSRTGKTEAYAVHRDHIPDGTETRVLRKIDFFLMPLLIITFLLQYVDKVILNGASQFGIIEDLELYTVQGYSTGPDPEPILDLHRFSVATLIFYWGCLAGLLPASWLAQRLPIGRYLACTVIAWGAVTMLTVVVDGYHGLLAQRFFLGVVECAVAPGFSIMIAMWWKRAERPLRYALWYTSTGLGGHIQGSLRARKYQYLILGAATVVWSIVLDLLLPQNPSSARFLKPEERLAAVERMRLEQIGIENKEFKFYQIIELLRDPVTWILIPTTFALHFVNGVISGFGSVIISSFGYSPFDSVLLTGAVGGGVFITCIFFGIMGTVVKDCRTWLTIGCEVCVLVGACLMWKLNWDTQRAGAIFEFVMCGFFAGGYMMILALAGANIAGHTKKTFMSGLLWCAWAIRNGAVPLTVKKSEAADHYPSCFQAIIGTAAVAICGASLLRVYLVIENKRRDHEYGQVDQTAALQVHFEDKTDRENKLFRYSL